MLRQVKRKSKLPFKFFLFFYFILGFYLSINTGISTDEFIDQYNWQLSLGAIKDFFGYNNNGYNELLKYEWRFHGVGFHYFSHIYILLVSSLINFENFSQEVADILINHSFIFITFFLSGIIAKK